MKYTAIITEIVNTKPFDGNPTNKTTQMIAALKAFIRCGDCGMNQPEACKEYGEKCIHDEVWVLQKYGIKFERITEKANRQNIGIEHLIRYVLINTDHAKRLIKMLELELLNKRGHA